ncbi:hypothetical protein RF11_11912 [Thelohanellus kitauei]|uniref:Uncharacterized protein n=1 Tax=Thelohanellus kitauei TaxID=669202 RepID=A0A0C2JWH1_THEKT|nr:hypothetical protein RF11_11912 [Thelohanellus kitauei]
MSTDGSIEYVGNDNHGLLPSRYVDTTRSMILNNVKIKELVMISKCSTFEIDCMISFSNSREYRLANMIFEGALTGICLMIQPNPSCTINRMGFLNTSWAESFHTNYIAVRTVGKGMRD